MNKKGDFSYLGVKTNPPRSSITAIAPSLPRLRLLADIRQYAKFNYGVGIIADADVKGAPQNAIIGGASLWDAG